MPPSFQKRDGGGFPRHHASNMVPRSDEPSDESEEESDKGYRGKLTRRHRSSSRGSSPSKSHTYEISVSDSDTDSSSYASDFASSEDPIDNRNARHFPPRLPVLPARTWPEDKMSAVNNIASWVSKRERRPLEDAGHTIEEYLGSPKNKHEESSPSGGRIEELWQELMKKRKQLADVKSQMEQKRKHLRQLRRRRDEADNAFMNLVRPLLVNILNQRDVLRAPSNLLQQKWSWMQKLRGEYHVLETSYEELEATMDSEENSLSHLETRFFTLLAAGQDEERQPATMDKDIDEANSLSDIPFILRGISPDGPSESLHPLYIEFTSAVGDLDNAKEEYRDLCWLKDRNDEEVELMQRTGQVVPRRIQELLDEFPVEEARMNEAVARLSSEVKKLKQACQEKKVMRKHMSARIAHELDPSSKFEDMELEDKETILLGPKTLAHARFPELLSQPDHILTEPLPLTPLGALRQATKLPDSNPDKRLRKRLASKEYAIDNLLQEASDSADKAGFVNRWLLQELRQCPLKVLLLHTIFISSCFLRIRDPWRWQCDVLHYWWQDDTTAYEMDAPTTASTQYSSRVGTPLPSRAASDSRLAYERGRRRRGSHSHGDRATVLA
jgi:predicted  nucleic acid-binding Zn-ribbon protein